MTAWLIQRCGVALVLLAGAALCALCVALAAMAGTLVPFYAELLCLGRGWNFMFVGVRRCWPVPIGLRNRARPRRAAGGLFTTLPYGGVRQGAVSFEGDFNGRRGCADLFRLVPACRAAERVVGPAGGYAHHSGGRPQFSAVCAAFGGGVDCPDVYWKPVSCRSNALRLNVVLAMSKIYAEPLCASWALIRWITGRVFLYKSNLFAFKTPILLLN